MIKVAEDLREALSLVEEGHCPFCGGTDLFVRTRKTGESTDLVGLEKVTELRGIEKLDGKIRIGASTTWRDVIDSPLLNEKVPLLVDTARSIGAPAIRNMATVGGNVCTGSPAGDGLVSLCSLGAYVEIVSSDGVRTIPIEDFVSGPGEIDLSRGELVSSVILDDINWSGYTYRKVGTRKSMAITIGSVASVWTVSDGLVKDIRIVMGSMAPVPLRLKGVEHILIGADLDEGSIWAEAGKRAGQDADPIDDVRGSREYRKILASNFIGLIRSSISR